MKLDQKYFVPFMGAGALITMIFIVYASFNYKDKQEDNFKKYISNYDVLLTEYHPLIAGEDSVALGAFEGNKTVILFWASWSEKSTAIMAELDALASQPDYQIVAATVMDATETVVDIIPKHNFVFIDAARLFNQLKVPGIPSYILLDERGTVIDVTVGYRPGVIEKIEQKFAQ